MDWNAQYVNGGYSERWDYAHPSQELVSAVAALDAVEGVALDVGCGAGREAIFLAQAGFHTVGVDLSPRALELARERASQAGVEVDWREGSALALPVADGSVSFVNDRGCFHHVAPSDRPAFAAEIARVLRPGGRLLLRGCRLPDSVPFVRVDAETVDEAFDPALFARGPLLPIELVSDSGTLSANLVILRRL